MNTQQEIRTLFDTIIARALCIFDGVQELERATIKFKIRGQIAGTASKRWNTRTGIYDLFIDINKQVFDKGTATDIVDLVAHEVAHLVCFVNPRLGRNHDRGWKSVCRMLGGDDSRTHDMPLERVRKVTITRHIYSIGGNSYQFTNGQHKKLQTGRCTVRGIRVHPDDYSETIKITK